MLQEITRFFERLAAATDEYFETLAEGVETAIAELETEISLIAEDIEFILLTDLLDLWDEDLDRSAQGGLYTSYWIYDDAAEQWRHRISRFDPAEFPATYIGDPSCRYNALSPQLRCAVNPHGPCEGCKDYESKSPES